jgi:hypothetical protein|tara:strand:- start:8108 stop:8290 length:183 start_codon:yes stop_codon:yes gene_type:complete
MNDLHPVAQARKDFREGLGIDENPFIKDSEEWKQYRCEWNGIYLIELFAEQQPEELNYGR